MNAALIRPAALDEVDRIASMYEWLFAAPGSRAPRWEPERAAAALARVISSDASTVLVAVLDGELAGFCTVYEDIESVRFGRRAWVEDLAVDPVQRSRGVGKQLLDAAKQWARDRGATHLELDSADARADAHRFYERELPSWRSTCFAWEL
jgi:GNAT superfamily N-acetyltransferase